MQDCCATPPTASEGECCPISGQKGRRVPWRTVAALTVVELPARQDFWICLDPECDVVYFGRNGIVITGDALHVEPGFKAGQKNPTVCYCFNVRESDLCGDCPEQRNAVLQMIQDRIREQSCACEVRNPTGKCCLGEVKRLVR